MAYKWVDWARPRRTPAIRFSRCRRSYSSAQELRPVPVTASLARGSSRRATLVEGTLDSTPRTRYQFAARTRKGSCTTLAHSRKSCACKKRAEKRTMMLSRARPLALRTLTRQQRALSAAPQPVYEPHVVLHQCRIRVRAETEPAGYFKTTRHAAAATPEQLDAVRRCRRDARTARRRRCAARIATRLTRPRKRRSPSRRSTRTAASWSTPSSTPTAL